MPSTTIQLLIDWNVTAFKGEISKDDVSKLGLVQLGFQFQRY